MSAFPIISTDPGVTRQVLADDPALMLVAFRFESGACGKRHHHPHVQSSYVASGRFRFTLGDEVFEISAGDSIMVPSNTPHACECVEAGCLIDSFTPRRDDFL